MADYEIDLTAKSFMIFGPKGSGKTNLAKHILSTTEQHFVYDPLRDYVEDFNSHVPEDNRSKEEFAATLLSKVIGWKPRLSVFDELNNFVDRNKPLPAPLAELNDWGRHYGTAWGGISRRPVQMHPDLTEIPEFIFAFNLDGRNDRRFFDNMKLGLGDIVAGLDPYHFIVYERGNGVYIHDPVEVYTDRSNYGT